MNTTSYTKIEWADRTWNPVTGCSKVSPGCGNCYAERLAERLRGTKAFPVGFDIQLRGHKLWDPLKIKAPSRIFVNSMSDLFHREIPDDYLEEVWETMLAADWHTFMILTKRAHRMVQKIRELHLETPSHIWLGVSVENQEMADSRLPQLYQLQTAGVRFVSAEPLLAPVDFHTVRFEAMPPDANLLPNPYFVHSAECEITTCQLACGVWTSGPPISWVIAGGESGSGRHLMDYQWARSIRDQCTKAAIPFFYKQGNAHRPGQDDILDGQTHKEFPCENW